jgi:hypothetical protein
MLAYASDATGVRVKASAVVGYPLAIQPSLTGVVPYQSLEVGRVALGLLAVIASPGGPVLLAPSLGLADLALLPEFACPALTFRLGALLMAAGDENVQLSLYKLAV